MKTLTISFATFFLITTFLFADVLEDPLLDAQLDLTLLKVRYLEHHPKVIEAEARVEAYKKTSRISPAEHKKAIQQRLDAAEAEDASLKTRFLPAHPSRIESRARLNFLIDALNKARDHDDA